MDDTDKVRALRDDALAQGLELLPPDLNASNYRFEPVDEQHIRYGLGGVKGTGEAAIEAIVAARNAGGPFRDLFDFCARIDKRTVNRRAIEALIRAGAFDSIEPRRAALLATVGMALDAAQRAQASAAQVSLFGEDEPASRGHALAAVREWTEAERLTQEKTAIGYYLSGHPFRADAGEIADITRTTLASLAARPDKVLVAGIVTQVRVQSGRRGKMAFVTLDDGHASQEVMVYNEAYDAVRSLLREDQLVIAEVKVSQRMNEDGEAQGLRIIVEALHDLAAMRRQRAKRLRIAVNGNAAAAELEAMLAPHRPGDKPVTVTYRSAGGIVGDVDLPSAWSVNLDDALIARLREWLSPANVEIQYHESAR